MSQNNFYPYLNENQHYSFRQKPDVRQEKNLQQIEVTWKKMSLYKAKCGDFFIVEYAELPNGTLPGKESGTWVLPKKQKLTDAAPLIISLEGAKKGPKYLANNNSPVFQTYNPHFHRVGVKMKQKERKDFFYSSKKIQKFNESSFWKKSTTYSADIGPVKYNTTYIIRVSNFFE